MVVANPDLTELTRYIRVGSTPIMIADHTDWVDPVTWEMSRQEALTVLDIWRVDWESRDAKRLLRHYAPELAHKDWAEGKKRNIQNKNWIKVGLSDISIFLYPDADLAVTTFQQDYASDRFSESTQKRLYWRIDRAQWRIAMEKTLSAPIQLAARNP